MRKIIATQGTHKIAKIYDYAESLAYDYPTKDVFLVVLTLGTAEALVRKHFPFPNNLHIISYSCLQEAINGRNKNDYYLVIDELDTFLSQYSIKGYSMTIEGFQKD